VEKTIRNRKKKSKKPGKSISISIRLKRDKKNGKLKMKIHHVVHMLYISDISMHMHTS
jgi:hypothetical protein